eukprot:COSAG02_NODE_5567_length_4225_cov_2.269026_2_plen_117_part_00
MVAAGTQRARTRSPAAHVVPCAVSGCVKRQVCATCGRKRERLWERRGQVKFFGYWPGKLGRILRHALGRMVLLLLYTSTQQYGQSRVFCARIDKMMARDENDDTRELISQYVHGGV